MFRYHKDGSKKLNACSLCIFRMVYFLPEHRILLFTSFKFLFTFIYYSHPPSTFTMTVVTLVHLRSASLAVTVVTLFLVPGTCIGLTRFYPWSRFDLLLQRLYSSFYPHLGGFCVRILYWTTTILFSFASMFQFLCSFLVLLSCQVSFSSRSSS